MTDEQAKEWAAALAMLTAELQVSGAKAPEVLSRAIAELVSVVAKNERG